MLRVFIDTVNNVNGNSCGKSRPTNEENEKRCPFYKGTFNIVEFRFGNLRLCQPIPEFGAGFSGALLLAANSQQKSISDCKVAGPGFGQLPREIVSGPSPGRIRSAL